jgi:hypothetical protein
MEICQGSGAGHRGIIRRTAGWGMNAEIKADL